MSKLFYIILSSIALLLLFVQCKDAPVAEKTVIAPVEKAVSEAAIKREKATIDSVSLAANTTEALKKIAVPIEKVAKETSIKKVAATTETAVVKKEEPAPVKKKKKKRAKIKFNELVHKFGTIKTGDKVKHQFKFKNTGNAPLVIKSVDVSCGCTFPSYPFLPIEPGKDGVIDVTFDSEHKVGRQKPTITVVTNARPRTIKLNLEGFVE